MIGYFNRYTNQYVRDKHTRNYVVLGLTVLWILILLGFGVLPAAKNILDARNAMTEARDLESQLAQNLEKINEARENYSRQEANIELIDAAVPKTPQMVTFANEIDLMAAVHNLVFENLNYQDEASGDSSGETSSTEGEKPVADPTSEHKSVNFEIEASGLYPDIRAFIEQLEGLPRFVEVQQVNIARSDDAVEGSSEEEQVSEDKLVVTIVGVVYFENNE